MIVPPLKPVTDELVGWRNAAIMSGHWVLHGACARQDVAADSDIDR
jgi:hypothetical protein